MKVAILLLAVLALVSANPWTVRRYVVDDPLRKVDAIVPLRGTPPEERVRLDRAAELVAQGNAATLLVSASGSPYYGQSVPKIIASYLEAKRFPKERLQFCENTADSTAEEAVAVLDCLRKRGAKQIFIVTSEYHSRRARMIFRRAFQGSGIEVWVHPVYNEDFWSPYWWERRRWAKTFFIETLSWVGNGMEQSVGWLRALLAEG